MELTDEEISELYDILTDASSDDYHGTSGRSEDDKALVSSTLTKVLNEAKQRKLWWAR